MDFRSAFTADWDYILPAMAPGSQSNGVPRTNGTTNGHASSYAAKHNLPAHFIGGNHLAVAPAGPVKDFVTNSDGHTVITSVGCPAAVKGVIG